MSKKANKTTTKTAKATKAMAEKPVPAPVQGPKADTLSLHLNKTGRLCIGKDAAARLTAAGFGIDLEYGMTITIDGGRIRLQPTFEASEDTLPVRAGAGRPYVSATKQFRALGFDGSKALDIEAKPLGAAGFEFRLA